MSNSRTRCSRTTPCIAPPKSSASANRSRGRAPASSNFITAPTTRTTSWSPNAAARLLFACGRSDRSFRIAEKRQVRNPYSLNLQNPHRSTSLDDCDYRFRAPRCARPRNDESGIQMRSLLFVPADSAKKLDKAMTSGADAIVVDLEDSIAPDGKARARDSAAAFVKAAVATKTRPTIMVRVNGLQTGLTDADLDAIAPAKPDAIMLPKAEGGASVIHADAKLAVREAQNGLPDSHI